MPVRGRRRAARHPVQQSPALRKQKLLSEKTIESYISKLDQCNSFLKEKLGIREEYVRLEVIFSPKLTEQFVV
jgi:hypothetical protein